VQVWLSIGFRSLLRRSLLSLGIADDKRGFGCNDAGGAVACTPRHRATVVTMRVDAHEHDACVASWMEQATNGLPAERLLQAFEQGFAALWGRANRTLADVTLMAILDRVLYVATEQYPFLCALKVEANGLRCQELQARADSVEHDQLAQGVRFVLVEFLTVLGNLTAEILTPALHSELLKVMPREGSPENQGSRSEREIESGGERAKS
jgi:hypothetical protein